MKSDQIQSFFLIRPFHIWTECGDLPRKCPYSIRIRENTEQKKLRIWIIFTRWSFQDIICGVSQRFILDPLLLILYINDLKNVSNALNVIGFADCTNLFISDKSINTLFSKANLELQKVNEQFKPNKLSLNTKKSVFPYTIEILRKITCLWIFQY